jgi:hypothetical protein
MLPAWMEISMKTFLVSALVQLLVFGVLGSFLLTGAIIAAPVVSTASPG